MNAGAPIVGNRPLSDKSRLDARLAALASAGVSGAEGRRLVAPDADGLLARILNEIDETPMPRKLDFVFGDRVLSCDATGRRLLRVHPDAAQDGADWGAIADTEIDASDASALASLRQLLLGLCDGRTDVMVRTGPLGRMVEPGEFGVAARKLFEAWDLQDNRPTSDEPAAALRAFVAAAGDLADAWSLAENGAIAETGGDASAFEAAGVADPFGLDAFSGEDGDMPALIALGPRQRAEQSLVLGRWRDVECALVIKEADLAAVMALWRRTIGP